MTVPIDIPPELFEKTLPDLLKYILLQKLTGGVLEWAKKRVKELWDKKEYGFTIKPELANDLQRISKSDVYKRAKESIGNNNKFLSLIKIGLRIEELSEQGKAALIADIKNDVYKKHQIDGVRILSMGSTGALISIIQHLSNVKMEHNYDQDYMSELFEKIIENWSKITIFHKSEHGSKKLETKIMGYMNTHYELFFVFAIGIAGEQAMKVIASLRNNGMIRNKGYTFKLYSRKEDDVGRSLFTWVFQDLLNFEKIIL